MNVSYPHIDSEFNSVTKRINYIDAMRGFTMLLVVFGHVFTFGFGDYNCEAIIPSIFILFRMPVFFFISGFIGYKAIARWNRQFYVSNLKKKLVVQIIPALFFFTLFQLCHGKGLFSFVDEGFGGYWFTFTLLEYFIVYFSVSLILNLLKCGRLLDPILLIMLIVSAFVAFRYPHSIIVETLTINSVFFFQFFIVGVIAREHEDSLMRFIDKDYIKTIIILLFVIAAFIKIKYSNNNGWILIDCISHLSRYLGMATVFIVFRSYANYFDKSNCVTRTMKFVGRRTLDIYLIHFFFVPNLLTWSADILPSDRVLFQLVVGFTISALIVCFCILISQVIRSSNILGYFLLGAKKVKK